MCGFDNPLSFKHVSEAQIIAVENFIKLKTLGILSKNLSDSPNEKCDVLVDDDQLLNHFGPRYVHDPSSFQFEEGDKIFIMQLVDHVKRIADEGGINAGLHHFAPTIQKSKSKFRQPKLKNDEFPQINGKQKVPKIDEKKLKLELLKKVSAMVEIFNKNQSADDLKFEAVQTNDSNLKLQVNALNVYGIISCPICQKEMRVYYNFKSNDRGCWVLSNYSKHLKSIHKVIVTRTNASKLNKIELVEDIDIVTDDNLKPIPALEIINIADESMDDTPKQTYADDSDLIMVDDGGLSSVVNYDVDQFEMFYNQFSYQITKVTSNVLKNSDRYEHMNFVLSALDIQLTVAITKGDGNCLFYSLAHQLFCDKINGIDHVANAKKLRADVVKYIMDPENFHRFELQLHDCVYERQNKRKIENMTEECKYFVDSLLSQDKFWAGAETLMAVSSLYETNIVVFNEGATCTVYDRSGSNYDRTIAVVFRLGYDGNGNPIRHHYDSVCDLNANDMYAVCKYFRPTASNASE